MSNRTLDSDWSYEQDEVLFAIREENPTPSYKTIAARLTQRFGIERTTAACIGRVDRVLKESEEALEAAQRRVRSKTLKDRVAEVRDPYHPLPEWFALPTPVERARALAIHGEIVAAENQALAPAAQISRPHNEARHAEIAERIEGLKRVMIIDQHHRVQKWTAEKAEARRKKRLNESDEAAAARREADNDRHRVHRAKEAERYRLLKEGQRAMAKEHRVPQKAVGLDKVAKEAQPEQDGEVLVVVVPKAASRHYRPSWTD